MKTPTTIKQLRSLPVFKLVTRRKVTAKDRKAHPEIPRGCKWIEEFNEPPLFSVYYGKITKGAFHHNGQLYMAGKSSDKWWKVPITVYPI